jgi:hypothetical protein
LQEPQLYNVKKQEEAYRAAGDEEVLQHLPEANGTQGSEVIFGFRNGAFSRERGAGRI